MLLETKLARPQVRAGHVPRRDLLAAMRDAASARLMLVAAPPGFGKTTLLAEWAQEAATPVAWLSLDEDDNDPARFSAYVAAALQCVQPELGARALAALRSPGVELVDVVLPLFINDLAAVDRELVLVLDDYHVITSEQVHEALAYLIEHAPRSLRVVMATREDPAHSARPPACARRPARIPRKRAALQRPGSRRVPDQGSRTGPLSRRRRQAADADGGLAGGALPRRALAARTAGCQRADRTLRRR